MVIWYEVYFKCGGFNSATASACKELDAKFAQYESSINPAERKKLAEDIQRGILENYYLVPVFRHAFINAIGPRIAAQKWQDVFPTITTGYAYPWEDIKLKEQWSGSREGIGHAAVHHPANLLQHRHDCSS